VFDSPVENSVSAVLPVGTDRIAPIVPTAQPATLAVLRSTDNFRPAEPCTGVACAWRTVDRPAPDRFRESPSMIRVHQLTKTYADLRRGAIVALAGVSFEAGRGEIYGLLGPNGAGKTTALRIISTVLRPTSGSAEVGGYDVVTQSSQARHEIGFVSANTAVYDRMTAWEMVEYFGRLYGIADALLRERMEQLFDRLAMQDIRDLLGAKMSTGMKQKVSIARALVHDPPVLVFDEATNGLDVLVARSMLEQVAELRDHGKCIIFSTHIMREAERLCDRVAIMHRGRILAEGSLEQLRDRHDERDLEEMFFQLISRHDERPAGLNQDDAHPERPADRDLRNPSNESE
jgi:sodium transport system ATP-binding protein